MKPIKIVSTLSLRIRMMPCQELKSFHFIFQFSNVTENLGNLHAAHLLKIARSHQLAKMEGDEEIIKFWLAPFLFQIASNSQFINFFSLEHTWPQFRRLSDIQVNTHTLS